MNPTYQLIDSGTNDLLDALAGITKSKVEKNTLKLLPPLGTGFIKKLKLNRGISLTYWHVDLNESVQIIKLPHQLDLKQTLTLSYIFTTDDFLVESGKDNDLIDLRKGHFVVFEPGNHEVNYCFPANAHTRVLVVNMHWGWLENESAHAGKISKKTIQEIIDAKDTFIYHRPLSAKEVQTINEMGNDLSRDEPDVLYLKGVALQLFSYLLSDLSIQNQSPGNGHHEFYYEKVKAVEKMISEHLNGDLPPLKTIARTFGLSESSLKKYFHSLHQVGPYEFYLQKKMEFAKTLLLEQRLSVKEITYRLGYEKSGSFIKMFKKHFNSSPGLLKKNNLHHPNGNPGNVEPTA